MEIPRRSTVVSRKSTINSQFVRAMAPYLTPTPEQILVRLKLFNADGEKLCAYCGDRQTEWDHLYPMMDNKEWTGYFTEINNLIPACSKCNQSRGNTPYRDWMRNIKVRLSPACRGIKDLEERVCAIDKAIAGFPPRQIKPEGRAAAPELVYSKQLSAINKLLDAAQNTANRLNEIYQRQANTM